MPIDCLEFAAIIDYRGFGYFNLDFPLTRAAIETYQNFYPGKLGAVYLVSNCQLDSFMLF